MNAKRKILAQGDRDGACFLYAIANSIQALRDKPVSQDKWLKCVLQLPFKLDDFLAGCGTKKLDDNPIYFEIFCEEYLKVLDVDSKIVSHANICGEIMACLALMRQTFHKRVCLRLILTYSQSMI